MNWNGDCKIEGCEREAVDSSGYCKKHKPQMSEQPQEWKRIANLPSGAVIDLGDRREVDHVPVAAADILISTHNAALAAERVQTSVWRKQAEQYCDDADAEREKVKLLVDALEEAQHRLRKHMAGMGYAAEVEDVLTDALAKVKPYPLPDGPTNRGRLRDAEK